MNFNPYQSNKKIRLEFFIPGKSSNIRNGKQSKFFKSAQKGGQKLINAQMIKTQEQNNYESKLTSARGVVLEKRSELH